MFFEEKVHPADVIKWGVVAGLFEGLYIGLATVVYAERSLFIDAAGWPQTATFFLISLIIISAIVTSVIVFAHPIFSAVKKHYQEALLTVLVSLITIIAVIGFVLFVYRNVLLTV